jgi:hypothetical protein
MTFDVILLEAPPLLQIARKNVKSVKRAQNGLKKFESARNYTL